MNYSNETILGGLAEKEDFFDISDISKKELFGDKLNKRTLLGIF